MEIQENTRAVYYIRFFIQMKKHLLLPIGIPLSLLLTCAVTNKESTLVKLEKTIELPHVQGRIDHLAINLKQQIMYIAAFGNNSVEVLDLKQGKVIHSIKNLAEPQGIIYIPESNSVFVANGGNGECSIFNADSFAKTDSLKLSGDADNVRYDAVTKKIYVGYGDGGIAIVDANTFKLISEIKFSGHPESFQLDNVGKNIYVNVPDKNEIKVISLDKNSVASNWNLSGARSNFPMALDEANHRLFIGCRHPSKMLVLDTQTGKTIFSVDIESDVDDVFYDSNSKQVYLSCGSGYIDVFKQIDINNYSEDGKIATHNGARTSLFIPETNQLVVASPSGLSVKAQLLIYQIKK